MKAFQLPPNTQAKLAKATPHKEFDGPDRKQAISLSFEASLSLNVLAQIHPSIPSQLVRRREINQAEVDGVKPVLFELLVPDLSLPISYDCEFTGYTLSIDRAMGDLELYGCKIGKVKLKEVTPQEGEAVSALVSWSVGSDEKITPELVGAICAMEAGDVWIGQKAPDQPVEEAAKRKSQRKKENLEAQGQQKLPEGGEPEKTPESALAESVNAGAGQASADRLNANPNNPFPKGGAKTDAEVKGEAVSTSGTSNEAEKTDKAPKARRGGRRTETVE